MGWGGDRSLAVKMGVILHGFAANVTHDGSAIVAGDLVTAVLKIKKV